MRTRALSSVGVVAVGLIPALLGGPFIVALLVVLCGAAYHEYIGMAARLGTAPLAPGVGYAAIAAFAVAPLVGGGPTTVIGIASAAVAAPLAFAIVRPTPDDAFVGWTLTVAGALYLGLPAYSGVALRRLDGPVDAGWLRSMADGTAVGWSGFPQGLGWFLVVLLATWIGDSAAYLVGRAIGRRPLAPRISPNKTVEGSLGGLVGSGAVAVAGVALFGLGLHPAAGALIGVALGVAGQLGDLAESMLKRQAGVKDSGTLIPGHGGMLDRIDALLFALVAGWLVAAAVNRATA